MMKLFLLSIAAFCVALAIAPFYREKIIQSWQLFSQWWQQQKIDWSLWLGRYFVRTYKRLVNKSPSGEIVSASELAGTPEPAKDRNSSNDQNADPYPKPLLGKLTPVSDAKNIRLYEVELASKLDDPDVKNIAITGPYGSGKSSIIKTFFLRYPQYQPLFVSLAAFKDERKVNGKKQAPQKKEGITNTTTDDTVTSGTDEEPVIPEQQKVLDDRIEYSILQQLFYHVRGKDVPFSRLKRIRTVRSSRIFSIALLVAFYTICILYAYEPAWLPGYSTWKDSVANTSWLNYAAFIGTVIGTIYVVYLLFKFQQHASMIKLNLDKAQLEIAPDKGSSVLNQHMDEIVYYFGATRHGLLVIEDLDRFKNPEIFVKLREINSLINNSLQIDRKVTFVYALRDDVFVDESRTKFFDFILPVVPVTNAANAASKILNMFEGLSLPSGISRNLLNDISLFVTDRRLIQNIYNEFLVYYHQLNNARLKPDQLLAMIIYKNIHPTDFSDLQSNKGMVYELFERRNLINEEMATEKQGKASALEQNIRDIEKEHYLTTKELRMMYVAALIESIYKNGWNDFQGTIQVNSEYLTIYELMEDEGFDKWRKASNVWVKLSYNNSPRLKSFAEFEKQIDLKITYEERRNKIDAANNADLQQMKDELQATYEEIRQIRGQSIREMLTRRKLSDIETSINQHKALAYLVGNGYVNEDYWLYVSYFEPGQLSQEDLRFIISVKNREALKAEHPLKRVTQVIMRLNDSDCLMPETLNYDLLNALLIWKSNYPAKLEAIVGQIATLNHIHVLFMDGFRTKYEPRWKELVAEIIKLNANFWTIIKRHLAAQTPLYLEAIVEYGDIENIAGLNVGGILASEIEHAPMFILKNYDHSYEQVTAVLQRFNLKFQKPPNTEISRVSTRILRYVYEHDHYAINLDMIDLMLHHFAETNDLADFNRGQASNILMAQTNTPIKRYLMANLDTYVKEVLMCLPDHSKETNEAMIMLLENTTVSREAKSAMIQTVQFVIDDLDNTTPVLYDELFQYYRVKPMWHNLEQYQKHQGIDIISPEIVAFISQKQIVHELSLDRIDAYPEDQQPSIRKILVQVLQAKIPSTSSKLSLLDTTSQKLALDSVAFIADEVINEMLKRNMIATEEHTLKAIITDKFDAFIKLLISHWAEVSPILKRLGLDSRMYERLISSPLFDENQKQVIFESMSPLQFKAFLASGMNIRYEIIALPAFVLSIEELTALAGTIKNENVVIGLIRTYENSLSEDLVIKLLEPLPASYNKIAGRQGKALPKSDLLLNLIDVLQRNQLLVESYEEKNKEVWVVYAKEE